HQRAGHLRRLHVGSTPGNGLAHHSFHAGRVAARFRAGSHLHHGGLEDTHGWAPQFSWPVASSGSSRPWASSACSSSDPPTCTSPTKICGKVERPFARAIISERSCGEKLASCST